VAHQLLRTTVIYFPFLLFLIVVDRWF
jgi:hypothetical protein